MPLTHGLIPTSPPCRRVSDATDVSEAADVGRALGDAPGAPGSSTSPASPASVPASVGSWQRLPRTAEK